MLHRRHATLILDPLEYQPGHVNAKGGRGVVHRLVVGHVFVIERTRADGRGLVQQVIAHKGQGHTGWPQILLGTRKGHTNLVPLDRARCNVAGAVHHQRRIAAQGFEIGQGVELHAKHSFVAADVDVARLAGQLPGGWVGQVAMLIAFVAGGHVDLGVFAGFLG